MRLLEKHSQKGRIAVLRMRIQEDDNTTMEIRELQVLRSKATELLLREEWQESIHAYTQYIRLCEEQLSRTQLSDQHLKLKKSLCLALSNRAEVRARLKDYSGALQDAEFALKIDDAHLKTLICKGRILLALNQYSRALGSFQLAMKLQANCSTEKIQGFLDLSRKLEFQSRTGIFDLSDWILGGFERKPPELAEYLGPIEVRNVGNDSRGLFATKSIEAGTLLLVTKAVAIGRGILPENDYGDDDSAESARLVMWKDFVDQICNAAAKSSKTLHLIYTLSTGDDEESLQVPDMNLFKPESVESLFENLNLDVNQILKILDVNSLTEDAISAKRFGKNNDHYGVGLWILASFVNHSCNPNARRVHVGDTLLLHASRDLKAGEEITFAYFDVLLPLKKRRELCEAWGFVCKCSRCSFEEKHREGLKDIEMGLECGSDSGQVVIKLEDWIRRWGIKGKEGGFLRASFWPAFCGVFGSERLIRRWGRRIPTAVAVAEVVMEAVGGDERVLKAAVAELKKNVGDEMEKAVRLGRGVYGKMMKKKAMRALIELCLSYEQHGSF